MSSTPKKNEILDAAQEMIQTRGYNAFSYADIAQVVGIRKASIHHYFPKKEDMGVAVIHRYRENFNFLLSDINQSEKTGLGKIREYIALYESVLHEKKLCLCGMLASDIETLPDEIKKEIHHFFEDNIRWLTDVLRIQNKNLSDGTLTMHAWQILSALQGSVILSRMSMNKDIFLTTSKELLSQFKGWK